MAGIESNGKDQSAADVVNIARMGNIERTNAIKRRSSTACVLLVVTCTLVVSLNIANIQAASMSLPTISNDLGLDVAESGLEWVVSAYSLSSACFLIFFGRLADLHGRKKTFLIGHAWLAVFSLGSGFSTNIRTLYVLRGLQGLGAAATTPASVGILAHAFPPGKSRSIAFSTFAAGAPIGGAIGTIIAGPLIEFTPATWRSPFFFLAGLSAVVGIGGATFVDKDVPSTEVDKRMDWIGVSLATTALALIIFVLGQGGIAPSAWQTPYIIALLIIGIALLAIFIVWEVVLERKNEAGAGRPPLIRPSMWKRARGKFAAMQSIALLEWAAFQSWNYWALLYYQEYLHLNPLQTGLRFLPLFIVGIACTAFVASVVGHVPGVILLVLGTAFTGVAGVLLAVIDPLAPYWAFGFPASVLSIFGVDFLFSCGSIFVAKVSLPHEQSLAGGLFQTLTQLGTALGIAVTTIVRNAAVSRGGGEDDRDAQLEGYKAAQWTVFAFGVVGSLVAIIFLWDVGVIGGEATSETLNGGENGGNKNGERGKLCVHGKEAITDLRV